MLPVLQQLEKSLDPFSYRNKWSSFDKLFQDIAGSEAFTMANSFGSLDVYENEHSLNVVVELPGCRREDIDVTLENGVLNLLARRAEENEDKQGNYYIRERSHGQWSRSIRLPLDVYGEKIEATYTDGVLKVRLDKAEKHKTHKIQIK